eukprot:gene13616-16572_t
MKLYFSSTNNILPLLGKTSLVTGGSRGIGLEICRELANKGSNVIVLNRNKELNESVVSSLPIVNQNQKHSGIVCDLSKDINEITNQLDSNLKSSSIDIFIHSAGITKNELFIRNKILDENDNSLNEIFNTNFNSSVLICRMISKGMLRKSWGRIIFIGSVVGSMGNKGQSLYSATKSAMNGFSKSLSKELGHFGITCNVVEPGFIESDMTKEFLNHKELLEKIPLKRFGTTQDVSKTVLFLIESDYITGQVIRVDGGLY